jgi:hypothetical protein
VAPASNGYKDAVFNRVRRARAEAVAAEQDVPEHILVGAVVVRPGGASLDQLIAEAEWHLLPSGTDVHHGITEARKDRE